MTLHSHFIRIAKKYASKTAFIDRSADRTITYSRALVASLILAEHFSNYEKGTIGVMLPTSAGCALSVIGLLMTGRTPVLINYSTGAAENAEYAQNKCDFNTIITSRKLLEKINCRTLPGMVILEEIMDGLSPLAKVRAAVKAKLPIPLLESMIQKGQDDENAVILFTSGSEKDPKAVPLTHKNIMSNIEGISVRYNLTENDCFLSSLPFFHVFGLTGNLWAPLYHGMTAVTYANPIDYRTVCDIVRDDKPTLMVGTPSFFWGYLRKSAPGDFDSLRLAICGADKCPDALREAFLAKHNLTLYEAYGTTETSPGISGNAEGMNKPGSVGKPFDNVQVMIENLETGEACKVGEIGRILVRGDMVMKGYLGDFEATSLQLRHGWYDTGDMGRLDQDGYLWHAGRLRRFVKIGGEMVSLVRVENALEKYLGQEIQCCVVEVPDAVKGARIVAALTEPIDEADMIAKLSADLPPIALPRQFVIVQEFPKMGSGKIDFRATTGIVQKMLRIQARQEAKKEEKKEEKHSLFSREKTRHPKEEKET